jgi:hypothetical protein
MGLYPKNLKEFVALCGVPRAKDSKVFIVDTEQGSDSNLGTSFDKPLLTLEAAYALCTADRHDTVLFVARDTADNPAATITWNKDYTHLIGVGCELPGVGQRCRVVFADAITHVGITFASNGCIVKNMQFNNEHVTGTATGIAVVTGSRNYFENVFFMSPTSGTAASYSLKVSGSENVFRRCTIGQMTNPRTAASYGLWLFGAATCLRNKFIGCEFLSWSSVTTHALVYVDAEVAVVPWSTWFEDCLFHNQPNGAASGTLAVAIDDNATAAEHMMILRGNCSVAGCTAVADPLTYVFFAETGTGTQSGLLMATVAE